MSTARKIYYKIRSLFSSHDPLHARFRHHPQGKWVIGYDEWKRLQKVVRDHKPQNVLDLGTGIGGSAVCVAATYPEAKVISVEQFDKCIQIADELIPPELKKRIRLVKSDVELLSIPEIPYYSFSSYKELPAGEWDMVIVDGPGPFMRNEKMINCPNGDFFKFIPAMKVGSLLYVDGRRSMMDFLHRFYGHYFELIEEGPNFSFTLMQRNERPYTGMVDSLLEKMESRGYFERNP